MTKRNLIFVAVVFVAIVFFNALFEEAKEEMAPDVTAEAPEAVEEAVPGSFAAEATPAEASCADLLPAHPNQLEYITELLGPEGSTGGMTAESGWRIKSTRHTNAWYVGAWISKPSGEREFGVWLVSQDPESPGMTNSVSGSAERLSPVIPKGRETRYATSASDAEAQQLESCASAN